MVRYSECDAINAGIKSTIGLVARVALTPVKFRISHTKRIEPFRRIPTDLGKNRQLAPRDNREATGVRAQIHAFQTNNLESTSYCKTHLARAMAQTFQNVANYNRHILGFQNYQRNRKLVFPLG